MKNMNSDMTVEVRYDRLGFYGDGFRKKVILWVLYILGFKIIGGVGGDTKDDMSSLYLKRRKYKLVEDND